MPLLSPEARKRPSSSEQIKGGLGVHQFVHLKNKKNLSISPPHSVKQLIILIVPSTPAADSALAVQCEYSINKISRGFAGSE